MQKILVTGGAGFIGSHLIDLLLADTSTKEIRVLDNFSSGRREHLDAAQKQSAPENRQAGLCRFGKSAAAFQGVDHVFHLAANPDARWGIENTRLDLEQETIVTYNVLEAMRRHNVPRIVLSSSGTVYGDVGTTVTHENLGPALPISLYGAGKVAAEALVSAFCGTFGLRGRHFPIRQHRRRPHHARCHLRFHPATGEKFRRTQSPRQRPAIKTLRLCPRHRGRDCFRRQKMRATRSRKACR